MRGAAKKAAMEGASEELERRSQYLSSLIQRTKIKGDGDKEKEVVEATFKPERRRQPQIHWMNKQDKVGEVPAADDQETKMVEAALKPERREHLQIPQLRKKEMQEEKKKNGVGDGGDPVHEQQLQQEPKIKIRAADMPFALQKRAFRCARETLASMPKLESKRLALALKKEFDSTYGPAWHCIVGTSFGSYVTHSLGGFLYFSIDKVYILLFRTVVEPIDNLLQMN